MLQREIDIQYQTFFILTKERMLAFYNLEFSTERKCRNPKEYLIQPMYLNKSDEVQKQE